MSDAAKPEDMSDEQLSRQIFTTELEILDLLIANPELNIEPDLEQ